MAESSPELQEAIEQFGQAYTHLLDMFLQEIRNRYSPEIKRVIEQVQATVQEVAPLLEAIANDPRFRLEDKSDNR